MSTEQNAKGVSLAAYMPWLITPQCTSLSCSVLYLKNLRAGANQEMHVTD